MLKSALAARLDVLLDKDHGELVVKKHGKDFTVYLTDKERYALR